MKKILAIIALTVSGTVFAGSATIEGQKLNTISGNDQWNTNFTLSGEVNSSFSVHTQLSSTQTDNTNAVSTRLEVGGTGTETLVGPVKGYVRVAVGEKYSSTGQFSYYSVEPGVTFPVVGALSGKVGYRYRTSFTNANVNKDTTDTIRVGVSYAITKLDSLGARYDRITGDSRQNGYALFYTRNF